MRGNTFTALRHGTVVTVWAEGPYYGRCGKLHGKEGQGRKGKGWVVVAFDNGDTAHAPFDKVAVGDNSHAKDD